MCTTAVCLTLYHHYYQCPKVHPNLVRTDLKAQDLKNVREILNVTLWCCQRLLAAIIIITNQQCQFVCGWRSKKQCQLWYLMLLNYSKSSPAVKDAKKRKIQRAIYKMLYYDVTLLLFQYNFFKYMTNLKQYYILYTSVCNMYMKIKCTKF